MNKKVIAIIILLLCIVLCIVISLPEGKTKPSANDSVQSQVPKDTIVVDTDSVSNNGKNLGYPKSSVKDDWEDQEDKADNDNEYDPYDDPDWDETTPGESRPEYFIRGNIPDPELYPEDEVKRWVEENGTEDEKRDVEEGNY